MRGIRGLGDPPVGDDGREEVPGLLDGALLGRVVEADDAEARDLALGPLRRAQLRTNGRLAVEPLDGQGERDGGGGGHVTLLLASHSSLDNRRQQRTEGQPVDVALLTHHIEQAVPPCVLALGTLTSRSNCHRGGNLYPRPTH